MTRPKSTRSISIVSAICVTCFLTLAAVSQDRLPTNPGDHASLSVYRTEAQETSLRLQHGEPRPVGDVAREVNQLLGLADSEIVTLEINARRGEATTIVIALEEDQLTLDLVRHSVRAAGYQIIAQVEDGSHIPMKPGDVKTLRGTVRELPGSRVAASLLDGGLYARIMIANGEEYWIEPITRRIPAATASQHVFYDREDIVPCGASCGAEALTRPPILGEPASGDRGDRGGCAEGVLCRAELACDADYPYYQDYGSVSAVEDRINSIINSVNIEYGGDVEITHEITIIIVRTSSAADPYTTTDHEDLLNEFRDHWESEYPGLQRDMAELFTGRDLDGGTVGAAWTGVVCTSLAYSLVQSDCCGSFACATDLSAHEMGHTTPAIKCCT